VKLAAFPLFRQKTVSPLLTLMGIVLSSVHMIHLRRNQSQESIMVLQVLLHCRMRQRQPPPLQHSVMHQSHIPQRPSRIPLRLWQEPPDQFRRGMKHQMSNQLHFCYRPQIQLMLLHYWRSPQLQQMTTQITIGLGTSAQWSIRLRNLCLLQALVKYSPT
jgi:hypothetical protein